MKKKVLIVTLLIFQIGFGRNLNDTDNLASLCKVWGFLKYYHPNVGKGNYNWDEQLLLIIPKIEKAKNKEDISKVYLDWIESLGEYKKCKSCKNSISKEYFDKNFDLNWIQNSDQFSEELSKKLKDIEENRFQGRNHYVSNSSNGNIIITSEPEYKNFEYSDQNYRLLSLFRFWNTIEYFYPYKYLTDQNWNDVLSEMIPKFINANNAVEYHLAMLETVVKFDDSHGIFKTKLTTEYFGTKFLPAKFKIIDDKAIVTGFWNESLSEINDLKIGDVIEKIDEKSIKEIINERIKYIAGSNINSKLWKSFYFLNGNNESVKVSLNRNGTVIDKLIHRYSFEEVFNKETKSEKYKIINGNVGYVNMAVLELNDIDKMMKSFVDTKAIIFDIRNYPNFTLYEISRYLNSEKKEFLKIVVPDLSYPGRFLWEKNKETGKSNKEYYKGKIVLLVNDETQSRAEFTAMCLQTANNVTTIGSQTAGADGNVSKVEFIGGYNSLMSGTGIFYPDGTQTQRKGIKIDIEVKPTIEGIQLNKDEVLDAAIKFLEHND